MSLPEPIASPEIKYTKIFINNEWVHPEGRKTYETRSPATGKVLAGTTQGTGEDVDVAVIGTVAAHLLGPSSNIKTNQVSQVIMAVKFKCIPL